MDPPVDTSKHIDVVAKYYYLPIWLPVGCLIACVGVAIWQWKRLKTKFKKASREKDEELLNIRRELEQQQLLQQRQLSQDSIKNTSLCSSPLLARPLAKRPPPVVVEDSAYTPPYPLPHNDYLTPKEGFMCTSPASDWETRRRSVPSSPAEGGMRRRDSSMPRNWQKGQLLGSGSFGSVYMGVRPNGTFFAVKVMNLHSELPRERLIEIKREIELMAKLRHRNIVRYLGVSIERNELNIFMEYVQGGSLGALSRRHGQRLEELSVAAYVKQIMLGVSYLHENNIIHRDLKGDNILVCNDGCIKLADFGTSKSVQNEMTRHSNLAGTPLWMAPEAINKTEEMTLKADIWSVGCVICELLNCGKPPWPLDWESSWQAIFTIGNWKEPLPPDIPEGLSSVTMDLLRKCFNPNPSQRSTAAELLAHPWLEESCGDSTTESEENEMTERNVAERLNIMIAASNDRRNSGAEYLAGASKPAEPAWLCTASTLLSTQKDGDELCAESEVKVDTPVKKVAPLLKLPMPDGRLTSRSPSLSSHSSSPLLVQASGRELPITSPLSPDTRTPLGNRVSLGSGSTGKLITPSDSSLCHSVNKSVSCVGL